MDAKTLPDASVRRYFWRGMRDSAPFLPIVILFALLFGVLSFEAGLNVFEALGFSVAVIAGAAQFTALQLLQEHIPIGLVLLSSLAVNLRLAMYSASITTHMGALPFWKRGLIAYFLVDQTYALSTLKFENDTEATMTQKWAYFLGTVVFICLPWYLATVAGTYAGAAIPMDQGLDFVLPITFIAMIGPALRTGAHRSAALTATILALCFAWLPFNLGLLVGGLAGMMVGAEVERRMGGVS